MYSIETNATYTIEEDGKRSLEVTYIDSDGISVGAYSEGDNFTDVALDILDQIEAAIDTEEEDNLDTLEESIEDMNRTIKHLQDGFADLCEERDKLNKRITQIHDDLADALTNRDELVDLYSSKVKKKEETIKQPKENSIDLSGDLTDLLKNGLLTKNYFSDFLSAFGD